ncbi:zinc finger protein 32 isoform X3 [Rattus norvegicus]|nr:zinc finger protein 32 isoform X2 [Rattus norvegicus]
MGIAAPTHMTALPSNQNQPAPGQRSWFLPRHRGDASHSASRHAQAPGSCGPATRSIAAAATGSTPALSVCGRAPLRYSSPAHGSIIRRGGDQSHRAGADMFGFPTATLLDCHGRYAQNVAFFNVMTEAHKYDSSEATGSSSWDFQSSFRREKLEQKSPDSKALQEDSPGVRQKVYDCQECGKSFRQKGSLTLHERIHTGQKPFECTQCGKSFRAKGNLVTHQRIHTGEKPYQCKECGKSFSQRGSLAVHERLHTGQKPYECAICQRSFRNQSNLAVHRRVHSGEKPYRCDQCGKAFSQKGSLIVHIRVHTGLKPYACSHCRKSFHTRGNCILHGKIHTGETPYLCGQCGKSFTQRGSLAVHQRSCSQRLTL